MTGNVLTKAQHIQVSSTHLPPSDLTKYFEDLQVRVYGDVGIVNGSVVATNKNGDIAAETVFTDVFVYRDGRWQAINAQENAVQLSARIDLVSDALLFALCSTKSFAIS